jgi:hypothetical protein
MRSSVIAELYPAKTKGLMFFELEELDRSSTVV